MTQSNLRCAQFVSRHLLFNYFKVHSAFMPLLILCIILHVYGKCLQLVVFVVFSIYLKVFNLPGTEGLKSVSIVTYVITIGTPRLSLYSTILTQATEPDSRRS